MSEIRHSNLEKHGRLWPKPALFLFLFVAFFAIGHLHTRAADSESSIPRDHPILRLDLALVQARRAFFQTNASREAGWQLARACFQRAEFARDDKEREALAQEGIRGARTAIHHNTNSAPGHFYLGLNLGQLARTRTLSAIGIVSEMEKEFLRAIDLEPSFQFAGPCRSLAMLYQKAPGWPTSIGSRSKSRIYFQKATELAPDYPENLLSWLEAELKWGDRKRVSEKLPTLRDLIQKAGQKQDGPEWVESLADWGTRIQQLEKGLKTAAPSQRRGVD